MLTIIRGKRLVGYHLPQKMTDFGLFDEQVLTDCTAELNEVEPAAQSPGLPNALAPLPAPVVSARCKAFQKLELLEAVDMAKVFNGPGQLEQRSITSLCEQFLNLNFRKRPSPVFAVSTLPLLTPLVSPVHGGQDRDGPLQAVPHPLEQSPAAGLPELQGLSCAA